MSLDVYLYLEADTGGIIPHTVSLYDSNITHNLNTMAEEAGVYKHIWYPEELGIDYAVKLIEPLLKAQSDMTKDPDRFKKHNPENGWGNYETLLDFIKHYVQACIEHPKALVRVWR